MPTSRCAATGTHHNTYKFPPFIEHASSPEVNYAQSCTQHSTHQVALLTWTSRKTSLHCINVYCAVGDAEMLLLSSNARSLCRTTVRNVWYLYQAFPFSQIGSLQEFANKCANETCMRLYYLMS